MSDERLIPGTTVHTKAKLLTTDRACRGMYGSLWKTKLVTGEVLGIQKVIKKTRTMTMVTAKWNLVNSTKVVTLHLSNIKKGQSPEAQTPTGTPIEEHHCQQGLPESHQHQTQSPNEGVTVTHGGGAQVLHTDVTPSARDNVYDGPVFIAHERSWKRLSVTRPMNGVIPVTPWRMTGPLDEIITFGHSPRDMTPYHFFSWMFPAGHLNDIVNGTNERLTRHGMKGTTAGEVLKFFGILILMSRFEFSDRRSLWARNSPSKFIPLPAMGAIMTRSRFEDLKRHLSFSGVGEDAVNVTNRWNLVSGFVKALNEHFQFHIRPSHAICIDESMSRWYGLGGDWIDVGLPHYVALDRKPESGCELKTAACGKSGMVLNMEITLSAEETREKAYEGTVGHGTAVTLRLTEPWFHTNRIICGDSYFASVEAAKYLLEKGLKFIGVVKTATREYPMKYLSNQEMQSRGQHISMVSQLDNGQELMAVMWLDRERRYFVSSTGTTNLGTPFYRERWRKRNGKTTLESEETDIPEVCQEYFKTCAAIDEHNRCRQDELKLEKKIEVKDWSWRVNTTLLSIAIVNAWKLYKGARGARESMKPNDFYCALADGLIENNMDSIALRQRCPSEDSDDEVVSQLGAELMVTLRKRMKEDGSVTNAAYQARCKICKKKTKYICAGCKRISGLETYICNRDTGRSCHQEHVRLMHDIDSS